MTRKIGKAASVLDYRELARRRLPPFLFEYIDGGSYAEVTLERNLADLAGTALRQRVLTDVSQLDLTTTLFGQKLGLPVALAPIGLAGMNARRGEVQAARAAEAAGIPFCLSTVSACPLDEVAAGVNAPFWFQLYMIRDRGFMRALLQKAKALGCSALIFTVDMPVPGSRYRDYHSGLAGAAGTVGAIRRLGQAMRHPRWAWDVGLLGRPHQLGNIAPVLGKNTGLEDFFAWMRTNFDPGVTWRDLDFIRDIWDGPLIIKGVLDSEDAQMAVRVGADGIVVSNHGGRQLDGVPSTARALPPIADAVDDRLTVLVDGGVRSGLDVVRMLALGAKGVLLGRAWVYALAAGGQAGVAHVLRLIEAEMRVAMALTGSRDIGAIGRHILVDDG
ncbi:L-lactate dehydrogenase [Sphingobium sp. TA15]|uniref:L-lactate dehydrogenase (Cytochrome) n=1 Tax=Sphingobium indicum (strain DSM 16413 / CCM 7287 / MTCC 6362 / UT26 / NBRC 101211 / UT26S) TaxID=452662 RepID=D4Z0R3_SPHIU|nr:FMN-dependent L-lactate dehydrogenase LldD [Sphingobium indicum]BAI96195.1 L-lactate dehydrogenase (cytochrome) [Sphingobium indicum UT26S]BDD65496.1 L-lactate dehydrogenase [Sphingobium sp. TA15]